MAQRSRRLWIGREKKKENFRLLARSIDFLSACKSSWNVVVVARLGGVERSPRRQPCRVDRVSQNRSVDRLKIKSKKTDRSIDRLSALA